MQEYEFHKSNELTLKDLQNTKGGLPILPVLGVITTAVSVGKILDQAGEWFLEGWNNPN